MRVKDASRDATYAPKALEKDRLGVQSITVISPAEDQDLDAVNNKKDLTARRQDLGAEDHSVTQDLDAEVGDAGSQDLLAEELDMGSEIFDRRGVAGCGKKFD